MHEPGGGPEKGPVRLPGLLAWQVWLLAFACGAAATEYPLPAATAALLLLFGRLLFRAERPFNRPLPSSPEHSRKGTALPFRNVVSSSGSRDPGLRKNLLLLVPGVLLPAAVGYAYALLLAPDLPADPYPRWLLAREKVAVSGTVAEAEGQTEGRLRLILDRVSVTPPGQAPRPLPGKLALTWAFAPDSVLPGQTLAFTGRLNPASGFATPGGFDIGAYWRRQGVFYRGYLWGAEAGSITGEPSGFAGRVAAMRCSLGRTLDAAVPESPGRAMLRALLLGDKSELRQDDVDTVRHAALAHTLALSGQHVAIVASFGLALAWALGLVLPRLHLFWPRQKLAVLLAAPLVAAYVLLGGAGPSLVRAGLMFAAAGVLLFSGRPRVFLDGLFTALALILAFHPTGLLDASLALSALAVGGLILGWPLLRRVEARLLPRKTFPAVSLARAVFYLAGTSILANLALLPLLLSLFGELEPGLFWNILWLPVLGMAVMPLGTIGLAASALPGLHGAGAWLLSLDASILDAFLALLRRADAAGLLPVIATLRPHWLGVLGYGWCGLCLLGLASGRRVPWPAWALAAALLVLPPVLAAQQDRGSVSLAVLDVGLGQSVVITAPDRSRYVVDGGGLPSATFDVGEAVVGPYLAANRLPRVAGVFLTHPQADHGGGLGYLLRYFDVDVFVESGRDGEWKGLPELRRTTEVRAVRRVAARAGDEFALGDPADGLRLAVLHPAEGYVGKNENDDSLVLRLSWRGRALALIPGDLERGGMRALLDSGTDLRAEALVLPHHGSDTGASKAFLAAVSPRIGLASTGFLNRYGFPGQRTRALCEGLGMTLYDTGRWGALTAVWDAPDAAARMVPELSGARERPEAVRPPRRSGGRRAVSASAGVAAGPEAGERDPGEVLLQAEDGPGQGGLGREEDLGQGDAQP